jgi:hypothetical protein
MKISRKMLLFIIAALGALLIGYGLIRQFTGFEPDETVDKYVSNGIIFTALALFVYNRKLVKDEKQANETAANTTVNTVEETVIEEDKDKPHWEQNKGVTDQEDI